MRPLYTWFYLFCAAAYAQNTLKITASYPRDGVCTTCALVLGSDLLDSWGTCDSQASWNGFNFQALEYVGENTWVTTLQYATEDVSKTIGITFALVNTAPGTQENTLHHKRAPPPSSNCSSLSSVVPLMLHVGAPIRIILQQTQTEAHYYPYFCTSEGILENIINVYSPQFGNARTLYVYKPPSLIENPQPREMDVLFVFDGLMVSVLGFHLNQLIVSGQIKDVLVVGIDSINRTLELSPTPCDFDACTSNCPPWVAGWDPKCKCDTPEYWKNHTGGLPRMLQFITSNVMPLIKEKYEIKLNPERTSILGTSLGGLAACYTPFLTPLITTGICMSPSLYWNCEEFSSEILLRMVRPGVRIYMDAGSGEPRILYPTRNAFARAKQTIGFFEGGNLWMKIWQNHYHDSGCFLRRMYEPLLRVFGVENK
jgi:enterochelin esterase-like enzyme